MSRDKTSKRQSGPTTKYGRLIVYDRETVIEICRRLAAGEDLQTICAKPPMPIGPVFLAWVQEHQEARAIYRSVQNFQSDCELAKELGIPMDADVSEWEDQVRANCERGWRADWVERKYIPPDWSKVYPLVGGPPVWSTENMQAYNDLINGFAQMLEPRDVMELIWTKEATDATWEAGRKAREKNCLPERKYQRRLEVLAEYQRQTRTAEPTAAKPAAALDHSRGLEAGFKYYQALDIAQSRATKRRDNALRQIARWRDGLGAKARHLSDQFVAEQAIAERYGAAQFLANAETDDTTGDTMQAAPPLASASDAADAAPPVPQADEAAGAASSLASAGEAAEAAPPLRTSDEAVTPPLASAGEAAPPLRTSDEAVAAPLASAGEAAESCTRACLLARGASGTAMSSEKQIAAQFLADAETDDTADDAVQAVPPLAPAGDPADAAPPVPLADAAGAASSLASAGEAAEAAAALAC